MKIVFNLNYHTVPGQSLWLHVTLVASSGTERRHLPLHWLDHQHWQTMVEVDGDVSKVEYSYQFQQENNGISLDEWGGPRVIELSAERPQTWLALDTWCSAGTVDFALDTDAFQKNSLPLPKSAPSSGSHEFQLHMAAVPPGLIPFVTGHLPELGSWDLTKPRLLRSIGANRWSTSLDLVSWDQLEYKYGLYDPAAGQVAHLEEWENRTIDAHLLSGHQFTRIADEGYRRAPSSLPRVAGVAIPVFSLRSQESFGIGEFADLKALADWVLRCGLKVIQILPINDTTSTHRWTDSYPYSAISVFALHPIYLRLQDLPFDLPESLESLRRDLNALPEVNYEGVHIAKQRITRAVFDAHQSTITSDPAFQEFVHENREWLLPYAVFCERRDLNGTADFSLWPEGSAFSRDESEKFAAAHPRTSYHFWLQYELHRQLLDAAAYLRSQGIVLKGDLPIGIDRESADAWSAPHLFQMETQAGAPPDAFAVKGQNWGFPTYNWAAMKEDGFAWWKKRFSQLGRYFGAFRIDHILGFFRIWQIPTDQVEGIMGWFDPAIAIDLGEFGDLGIDFDHDRFCHPWLPDEWIDERFGDDAPFVRQHFLEKNVHGRWRLRDPFSSQKAILARLADPEMEEVRSRLTGLLDCASNVLFFEVPGSNGERFHPRYNLQETQPFQDLDPAIRGKIDALYIDYFYHRQENFWQAKGLEKLPAMRGASDMLLCGEDLGMVPACVPGVLKDLGILSLEIQRMPKSSNETFSDPSKAPYLSVVSPSTHDMSTLRGWWREDSRLTARFAWTFLGEEFPPLDLSPDLAARIISQHLHSPAMLAIFPLQDLLAVSESLRHPDPEKERINNPADPNHYWRYRMHLPLENLLSADDFNDTLRRLIVSSGR